MRAMIEELATTLGVAVPHDAVGLTQFWSDVLGAVGATPEQVDVAMVWLSAMGWA